MRFSLRTLLFVVALGCTSLAWITYCELELRCFWPLAWLDLVGITLIGLAHVTTATRAIPLAIGGFLLLTSQALNLCHTPLMVTSAHPGNFPGDGAFIERIAQYTGASIVFPAIALSLCMRLAMIHRRSFTVQQQTLLTIVVLIVVLDLAAQVYLVHYFARHG